MAKPLPRLGVEALTAFLTNQLAGIDVESGWTQQELEPNEKRINVLRVGAARPVEHQFETMPKESREVGSSDSGDPVREFRYDLDCLSQSIRLELWATSEVDLEDIEEQLQTALRQGTAASLGAGAGGPFRDGPLLRLGEEENPDGFVDFTFDWPSPDHTPDQHIRHEWRASIDGEMLMRLSLWATSSYQAEIILKARVSGNPVTAPLITATLTNEGVVVEEAP